MIETWGRVAVTGGAGFIGSHLIDRLLKDSSAEVVVLDNLSRGRRWNIEAHRASPRLRFIEGDIRDGDTVAAALEGANVVFHLAAQATVMGGVIDSVYNFSTNVTGTFNVLKAASDAKVKRFVFSSSREVYGDPIVVPVDEGHPVLPVNQYGASKVAGEAFCRAFRREHGLDTVILRLANVFGPRDHGRVIPLWMQRAADGEDLLVYGGRQILDLVWIGDVVESFLRAAQADGPLPPINVASGTGTSIMDLANRICALSGGPSRVTVMPPREMEVVQYIGSTDRMRDMLGVEPTADPLSHLASMVPMAVAATAR
jgi:UDP-glucose 4-epimerase